MKHALRSKATHEIVTVSLWSKRWTVAQGWHWVHERKCLPTTQEAWLASFQKNEPEITFKLAVKMPRL